MAAPARVVTGDTAVANDLNQLIDLLEGAASLTEAFKLVSSSGENFIIKLADAAGARKLVIQDSAGVEVASIDSDGGASFTNVTSSGSVILPTSTSPAQTTDGQVVWDSDDNLLTVGDGASRKTFYYGEALPFKEVRKYTAATQTYSADTTYANVVAAGSPATMSVTVAASEVWHIRGFFRVVFTGTGGLKMQLTGPGSPTQVRIRATTGRHTRDFSDTVFVPNLVTEVTAFSTGFIGTNAAAGGAGSFPTTDNGGWIEFDAFLINGVNAGTVTLQAAQNSANGTSVIQIGSYMFATKLA